jgi:hypothetical protein
MKNVFSIPFSARVNPTVRPYRAVLVSCLCILTGLSCQTGNHRGDPVEQVAIPRIDAMPSMPEPYKILDWKQKAKELDDYIFDFDSKIPAGTVIWLDSSQINFPQTTFGIYTAIHDVRQGKSVNNGFFHEALNSFPAILGAGLTGIDKTNQNGYNYVKMIQNYFNSEAGQNIVMNNITGKIGHLGGGYGRDWWYNVFPNVLYYAICDVFPEVERADSIQRVIAEQFYRADSVLNGNYDYSSFDYREMKGIINQIPFQQDAAGGHGYVLFAAHRKFGDAKYLEGAKSAIQSLDNQTESRFYEILLPVGIYTAARLNAEEGTNYDIHKMLNWVFEGCKSPTGRTGWGIISDRWGDYDVAGLQGSLTDGGGYAFLMNSIKTAMPLVPMVKYQPRYARAIGRWMLNNVNACRLFFPDEIDDAHQWLPEMKDLTRHVIAYEGLRKTDAYGKESLKGVSPVALGDGPLWIQGNPPETMFSIYSTTPLGIFGAITDTTDVQGILRLNLNATDFYADRPYPVYLYYNPHPEEKSVACAAKNKSDLFDIVCKQYLARNLTEGTIKIAPDAAVVIVELPAGTRISVENNRIMTDLNFVISYY